MLRTQKLNTNGHGLSEYTNLWYIEMLIYYKRKRFLLRRRCPVLGSNCRNKVSIVNMSAIKRNLSGVILFRMFNSSNHRSYKFYMKPSSMVVLRKVWHIIYKRINIQNLIWSPLKILVKMIWTIFMACQNFIFDTTKSQIYCSTKSYLTLAHGLYRTYLM